MGKGGTGAVEGGQLRMPAYAGTGMPDEDAFGGSRRSSMDDARQPMDDGRQDGAEAGLGDARARRRTGANCSSKCAGKNVVRALVVLAIIAMVASGLLGHKQVGCFSQLPIGGQYALYAVSGAAVVGLAIDGCRDRRVAARRDQADSYFAGAEEAS
ncbi:MAG: hypothetical protein ACKVOH_04660 [Chlamydiales bacterium]